MKSFKKVLSILLVAVFAASMLAACGGSAGNDTAAPAGSGAATPAGSSASAKTLSMATNAAFPPYEYMEGGDYVGIDIEIAKAIADSLGAELVINDVEFGSIIGGVQSGKYDMGIAGMTVTDERLQSVNFSETYATGVQVIIVKSDSDIASAADIADKMIGVQMDTTGDIYCCEDFGDDHVTEFKTGADAVQALVTGKVDCVCFHKKLLEYAEILMPDNKVVITGKVQHRGENQISILIDSAKSVDSSNLVTVNLKKEIRYEDLCAVKNILAHNHGDDPVMFKLPEQDGYSPKILTSPIFWVSTSNEFVHQLNKFMPDTVDVTVRSLDKPLEV